MLGLFKKGRREIMDSVNKSLSRVDRDVYAIQQWIGHLHDKHDDIKNTHARHVELTRKEISDIQKTVHYLQTHNAELNRFIREIITNILDLKKNYENFGQRIEKLEKGHLRTLERTIEGQIEDKSLNTTLIKEDKPVIVENNVPLPKNELNGSQVELVNVLYHSDRPLSYAEIARILGKKSKSIRNLIYELRAKKIDVKSKPVGIRKKVSS